MKRLTIPGSGTESRATKPARVSAPATLGGAAFGASREDTGADLLEAAQAAEIEQQATLEAAPVEQSYPETLALYVQAKHDQVEHIEDRLENLIDRQQARLQQTQASAPGRLPCPALSEPGRTSRRSSRPACRRFTRAWRPSARSRKAWACTRRRSKSWRRARCAPRTPSWLPIGMPCARPPAGMSC